MAKNGKLTTLPSPLPSKPDQFFYWFLSAIAGALAGGYTYNALKKKDPL